MRNRLILLATFAGALLAPDMGAADSRQYCIVCEDPRQSYVCQVDTPHANPSDKGLQLYCIIRTSKDGGHRTCAVDTNSVTPCTGPVKTYTFQAPEIPDEVKSAVRKFRERQDTEPQDTAVPPQKGGEPETLIDLTKGAVGVSKEGLKSAGETVGGAAGATTRSVGKATRGVGKGIAKAAGKVGSATKKTGGTIGGAAKTAWDCLTSWFSECGGSDEEEEAAIPESGAAPRP